MRMVGWLVGAVVGGFLAGAVLQLSGAGDGYEVVVVVVMGLAGAAAGGALGGAWQRRRRDRQHRPDQEVSGRT